MRALAIVALGALLAAPSVRAGADDAAATATRAAFLKLELAAARTGEPYLVLDPTASTLTLRRRHVDLLVIPVRATVGCPRGADDEPTLPAARFTLDSPLREPDRQLVTPPRDGDADSSGVDVVSVESMQAAHDRRFAALPPNYRLRFAPDLDVVVAGEQTPPTAADRRRRAWRRWEEARLALAARLAGRPPRMRLLMTTDPARARRLYLALEPGIALLVAPPVDR